MTDIVELAKQRRHRLELEMAKLDEFILIGEALLSSGDETDLASEPAAEPVDLLDDFALGSDTMLLSTEPSGPDSGDELESEEHHETEDDDELLLTDMAPQGGDAVGAHVGMRIRHRRWMQGISQEDLAKTVGVTVGQIQRIETGDSSADSKHVSRIAAALNVPVSYFLEGMLDEAGKSSGDHSRSPSSQ